MPTILLVTVTEIEAKAVLSTFSQAAGQPWKRHPIGGKTYYALGRISGAEIYMVQSEMGTATPGGALMTVRQAAEDLHPIAAIMVGIAFGMRPDKQDMGDILVSKQLMAYEPGKIKSKKPFIPRGDRVTASTALLDKFRSGCLDWNGAAVWIGLILTGEKLVSALNFREQLLKLEPEAIGGEMEAGGLYVAAQDAKLDWIMVKAICDWGDSNKDDKAQPIAAQNAASFVLHVLQQGGWEQFAEKAGGEETPKPTYGINISGNTLIGQNEINVRTTSTNVSKNLLAGETKIDLDAKPGQESGS